MKKTTSTLITQQRSLPWVIWGLGALFYSYEFFLQVSPGVMAHDLMHTFKVNATQLGNLGALYFYAYAMMQIPVGVLLDSLGPRRLLTIAIIICACGAIFFGSAHTFWVAGTGRFLTGLGSAFAAVGCLHLAATGYPLNDSH